MSAPTNRNPIARIVSVLTGAAVVFGLEQGLGMKIYIAIPAGGGVPVYAVTLLAMGLVLGTRAK